jgi:chromatin remodeling complex protein RSC6
MAAAAKPNAAFHKPLNPSPELAAVIGTTPISRPAATAVLWRYIKSRGLQDPADKRQIVADAKLRPLFGCDRLNMLKLAGVLNQHLHAA